MISNVAWKAPEGEYPAVYQAGVLVELSGDPKRAMEIRREAMGIDPGKSGSNPAA